MLVLLLLLTPAVVEETRPVAAFTEVFVRGGFDVDILPGDKPSVVVVAPDAEFAAATRTRVEKGALLLEGGVPQGGIRIRVVHPGVKSMRVSGQGLVRALGLKQKSLLVKHAGYDNVVVTGTIENLEIVLDGPGLVEARDARAKSATVTVNGVGVVEVVADKVDAIVTGDGDVRYGGSPALKRTITGGGSVEPLGTPPTSRVRSSSPTSGAERRASDAVRSLDPLHR